MNYYDLTIKESEAGYSEDQSSDPESIQSRISRGCQRTKQIPELPKDYKQQSLAGIMSAGPRRAVRRHLDFGFICREARGCFTEKAQRICQRASKENPAFKSEVRHTSQISETLKGLQISHVLISKLPNHPPKTFETAMRLYGAHRHIL